MGRVSKFKKYIHHCSINPGETESKTHRKMILRGMLLSFLQVWLHMSKFWQRAQYCIRSSCFFSTSYRNLFLFYLQQHKLSFIKFFVYLLFLSETRGHTFETMKLHFCFSSSNSVLQRWFMKVLLLESLFDFGWKWL